MCAPQDELSGILEDRTAQLLDSEARFRAAFEQEAVPMALIAPDGRWLRANGRLCDVLGYSPDEVRRKTWAQVAHARDTDGSLQGLRQLASGERASFSTEIRLVSRSGQPVWLNLTATPVAGPSGEAAYFVAVFEEVARRREAERALLRSEVQLRQAQRLDGMGRISAGVAHDFNNLLAVVLLHAGRLLSDETEPSRRASLEAIKNAAERAAAFTRQLLAIGRRQILQLEAVDLNDVIEHIKALLCQALPDNVEIVTDLLPGLSRVMADRAQLEQIVMNLTINSRDAMPSGGRITIRTTRATVAADDLAGRRHARPGDYVMLALTDTGVGMSPEVTERIFDPFFTTKQPGIGTGLGLSVVYGIVEQSGGFIEVRSVVGKGTTLEIYLPCDETGPRGGPQASPEEKEGIASIGLETVLLAEDDDLLRKSLGAELLRFGYRALEARSGTEALRLCRERRGPVHLLISDVVMPGMSGPELYGRLSRIRREMKVLYMTGHAETDIVDHGVLAPGIRLLNKPFTAETLAREIRAAIDAPTG